MGNHGSAVTTLDAMTTTPEHICTVTDFLVQAHLMNVWATYDTAQKNRLIEKIDPLGDKPPLPLECMEEVKDPKTGHPIGKILFSSCHAILSSPNFYAAHINDKQGLADIVNRLVKSDRLPSENSLEALLLLRGSDSPLAEVQQLICVSVICSEAWCLFDICQYNARYYRQMAHAIFVLVLVLAVGTTVITIMSNKETEGHIEFLLRKHGGGITEGAYITVWLGLITTSLLSFQAFSSPHARWQGIRSCSENLRSHIWMFRTRAAPYNGRRPEDVLQRTITTCNDQLLRQGNLVETDISREYEKNVIMFNAL